MSVITETSVEIAVPTKLIAGKLASNIAQDNTVMNIDIKQDCKGRLHLYLDGDYVFTEPGE